MAIAFRCSNSSAALYPIRIENKIFNCTFTIHLQSSVSCGHPSANVVQLQHLFISSALIQAAYTWLSITLCRVEQHFSMLRRTCQCKRYNALKYCIKYGLKLYYNGSYDKLHQLFIKFYMN